MKVRVAPFDDGAQWPRGAHHDIVAVLDVELDDERRVVAVTLGCGPEWGDRDAAAFVAGEVRPRLERLATGEAVDDPWSVVSTGHLQLTLTERLLPAL